MGVRLTSQEGVIALFDSVTGLAFGPVFGEDEDGEEAAESYLGFLAGRGQDARTLTNADLVDALAQWRPWYEQNRLAGDPDAR